MPDGKEIISKIKRFYLFYGTNDYRISERVSALIGAVVPEEGKAFDLDRFEGRRCDVPVLINSISTPPVMSPLRVAVLTACEKLPARSQKTLAEFLDKIPEYSVLAMTAGKADKRSAFFKKLLALDKKQSFFYGDLSATTASKIVIDFAAKRGKTIESRIAEMLVSMFGTDPYRLESEVEKLALFMGEAENIEKKDLAFASGFTKIETPYDLPDLILAGQLNAALEVTSQALMSGISEMQILYILKNHLSRLCVAVNSHDIKEAMKTGPMAYFVAKTVMTQSRKVRREAVFKGLEYIFRAEYSLKSARFRPAIVIESLILMLFLEFAGNNNS